MNILDNLSLKLRTMKQRWCKIDHRRCTILLFDEYFAI